MRTGGLMPESGLAVESSFRHPVSGQTKIRLALLRRALTRALVVAAMTAGLLGAVASSASAQISNNWYVSPSGTDVNNDCTGVNTPCQTIGHTLVEQGADNVSGTIHLAAGTYTEQITASTANDGVTIKGAGASDTIIQPPSSGLLSDTDTDSSNPQFYVVDVGPGTTGFNLERLTVNGLNGISFLDGDSDGCSQDYVGVYYHESSGSMKKVDVTGIDLPAGLFGCQGGTGVYVNSTSSDPSNVTMSKLSLTAPAFLSTTKATLPAGTYSDDILPVKAEPPGYSGGSVVVNGYILTATPDGPKSLLVTGTTDTSSPTGSTVNYDPYTPAYDKNGIACDDNSTTCSITSSTIDGDGPQNGIAQNGILAWGSASVTVGGTSSIGNTVSGDTWTGGGGSGNAASGILLLNGGVFNVSGNTVSNSDVNIYAGEVQAYGLVNPAPKTWDIANNIVSGATSGGASTGEDGYGEGIQIDSTTNNVQVTNNEVSGSPQANILLTGVSNASIGGFGPDVGNIVTGSSLGAGIVVGGPGTECELAYGNSCAPGAGNPDQFSSTGNTIAENSATANGAGVVVEGQYNPSVVGPSDPEAAYSNTLTQNVWQNNAIANVADFSANGTSPTTNTYSSNASDGVACEPTQGGSAALNSLAGGTSVADVSVTQGQTGATTTASSGFADVSDTEGVTDGRVDITEGTTVGNVTGNSLILSQNASGTNSNDILSFGYLWAC